MHLTLRHKVNGAIIITFILIAVVFSAIQLPFQQKRLQTSMDSIEILLQTLTDRDLEQLANEIFDTRLKALEIRLKQMKKVEGTLAIEVFDNSGKLLAFDGTNGTNSTTSSQGQIDVKDIKKALQHSQIKKYEWEGHSTLRFTKKVSFLGEDLGFIRIYYSMKKVEHNQKMSLIIFAGMLTSILFVMLIVLNLIMSKTILNPIMYLRNATESIARGNLDEIINLPRKDELGNLANSFMKMQASVKHQIISLEVENKERKKAENELRNLRNYLSNIINSMPSVLIGVDTNGKVTQWNKEAQLMSGVTIENALGHPLETLLPNLSKAMGRVGKAISERREQFNHKQARIKNGKTVYEDITIYPLIANGVEGAVIRVDDVTSRIRMEEAIIQSEKMLSVGGLAAGMAHEINNPLAGMMQTASVMGNRLGSNLNIPANQKAAEAAGTTVEAIHDFMEAREIPKMLLTISEAGKRIADIVSNMLSFARKGDTRVSSYDVGELLDKTLELAGTDYDLKKQYDFKMIKIKKEYQADMPLISCEGSTIQQVLLNILSNGAQAMQQTMTDKKPCFMIKTSHGTGSNMIQIEIRDNGPGMDAETSKRIFEPFFTTKPEGVGTGLGLSVSYFIITKNHGGTMHVESEPGQGACFVIRLPVDYET